MFARDDIFYMSKTKLAVMALIVANVIWGASSPLFKWALHDIHPFTLAFLRFFVPVLFILILTPREIPIRLKHVSLFALAGLLGVGINITGFFMGIERTASINAPIISSSGPVFLLLGSMLFLREHPSKKMLLGNVIGLTGVLLIILEPILHANHASSVAGNLFLILATLGAVGGTLCVKRLARRYNPLTIVFWTFLIGSATFLPGAVNEIEKVGILPQLQFPGLVGALFGIFLSSFLAYSIYFYALKYMSASQTTVFTYMDPIVAVLIAAPLLHEYPTILFLFGSFLVFFGIFVAEGRLHYHPLHLFFRKK